MYDQLNVSSLKRAILFPQFPQTPKHKLMKTHKVLLLFVVAILVSLSCFSQDLPKIVNLSGRNSVSKDSPLIGGFSIQSERPVLIRAVGPGLSSLNVKNFCKDPRFSVYDGNCNLIAENDDWNNDPDVRLQSSRIGAFPLVSNSRDAAVLVTLPAGNYTVVMTCAEGADGIALLEMYDMRWAFPPGLKNLSLRGRAGTGENALMAGISIAEPGKDSGGFLIRAVGPGLESFGVTDFITEPMLLVQERNIVFGGSVWWTQYSNYFFTSKGAFALPEKSKDVVFSMLTGPYGGATVLNLSVQSKTGIAGTALLEFYEWFTPQQP